MTRTDDEASSNSMMRRYYDIKEHPNDIVFFRLGDFYEMFEDDTVLASKFLGITLTGRGKDENRIPMCGVPFHSAESYIHKLVHGGYRVAVCEQVEAATQGPGITKREVVHVHTPGTLMGSDDAPSPLLAAVYYEKKSQVFGLAVLDISTGYCAALTYDSNFRVSRLDVSFSGKNGCFHWSLMRFNDRFKPCTLCCIGLKSG